MSCQAQTRMERQRKLELIEKIHADILEPIALPGIYFA
jgi:hypothetical protein